MANLTGEPVEAALEGAATAGRLFLLDAESFVSAAQEVEAAERLERDFSGASVALGPYAVARLRTARA